MIPAWMRSICCLLAAALLAAACSPASVPVAATLPATALPAASTPAAVESSPTSPPIPVGTITVTLPPRQIPISLETPAAPAILPVLTAGAAHTCLIDSSGRVSCWGDNQFGQLGGGDGPYRLLEFGPQVEEITNWIEASVALNQPAQDIAAGGYHTCAVLMDGSVQCWGRNTSGQLGNSTSADSRSPQAVQGLQGKARALAAGFDHTCALLENGSVQCWGENGGGQLGSPEQLAVLPLDGQARQLAAGVSFSCALLADGSLTCWGSADWLTGSDAPTPPILVALAQPLRAVSAGQYHLCGLFASGAVQCWGGLSSAATYTPGHPLEIHGLGDSVLQMAAGGGTTCALLADGSVDCWGDNYFGQLGDGTDLGRLDPVEAAGLAQGALRIAVGSGHACAALVDGGVRCWGDLSAGQLGDSQISWLPRWQAYISGKYGFSIAYPLGWKVLEVPNAEYQTGVDQVWFAADAFPRPQTGARPEVSITMLDQDPSGDWQPQFYQDFRREEFRLGGLPATRISGINKEMGLEELVVILALKPGTYLLIAFNGAPEQRSLFEEMLASFQP